MEFTAKQANAIQRAFAQRFGFTGAELMMFTLDEMAAELKEEWLTEQEPAAPEPAAPLYNPSCGIRYAGWFPRAKAAPTQYWCTGCAVYHPADTPRDMDARGRGGMDGRCKTSKARQMRDVAARKKAWMAGVFESYAAEFGYNGIEALLMKRMVSENDRRLAARKTT